MKHILLNILIIIILPITTLAQIGGQATYGFLEQNISPFSTALGGKIISNPSSSDLIFYNPALLSYEDSNQLSLSYQAYVAGINIGGFSYNMKRFRFGNLALGVHYANYGKFDQYDEFGNYYGQFTASDYIPFVTYSLRLDSQLVIGLNLKTIYSNLETYTSYGYGLDLGMFFKANDYLFLALVARNLGKQIKPYFTTYEPLPFNLTAGLTGQLRYAPLRFNITLEYLNRWDLRYKSPLEQLYKPAFADTVSSVYKATLIMDEFLRHTSIGTEIMLSRHITVLLGYYFRRAKELTLPTRRTASGLSLGLFINTEKFTISYSMQKISLLTAHTFGITLNINKLFFLKSN